MELLIFILAGALAGTLSGLFGVGGGLIIVPIFSMAFTSLAFPEQHVMHMALGTSLASIIFTSLASMAAHHNKLNVDWNIVRTLALAVMLGTFFGSFVVAGLPTASLKLIFAIFISAVATQLILNLIPNPHRKLPGLLGTNAIGILIGIISSLVGIGGGTLAVPFLIYCNIAIRKAIGTSAALGLPISLSGCFGFVLSGWTTPNLPAYSLGYVYMPAVICVALISIITAPWGVRLAHNISTLYLTRAFAVLLYAIGLRMLWDTFN